MHGRRKLKVCLFTLSLMCTDVADREVHGWSIAALLHAADGQLVDEGFADRVQ